MKAMKRFLSLVLMLLLLCSAGAYAQSNAEPTVDQVYQTAKGGDLAGARSMIDQVVTHHPKSGKAHYVKAEIAAAQHDTGLAREELATAERLSPGLPFAKPQSVSSLRAQIDRGSSASTSGSTQPPATQAPARDARRMGAPAPASSGGGFSLMPILLIGLAVFAFIAWRGARRRAAEQQAMVRQPGYPPQGEPFGRYPEPGPGGYPGPAPYGAPGAGYYPPPQQPSMGSSIARGVGTGLAMGAGMVAAEEIGHRIFDHDRQGGAHPAMGSNYDAGSAANSPLARDAGLGALTGQPDQPPDFGGQDFGVDPGGWDDGGSMDAGDVGGGNDWDT
jgi:uncharacterized protein